MSSYRKDVDGLRAIAVLLVVFYHLGVQFVQAGFIGVDVFFVISGFLITQHIVTDIHQGNFSLKHFYLKRMRRILPALLIVLIVSTIIAYFILLPEALLNYAQSLLATLLMASNIYFWKFIQVGYFATDATVLPLLHTWSLGVEEQFYIFWPLLLISAFKIFSKRGILLITAFSFICSFLLYYYFRSQATAVFYLPLTRAFELLTGAILALIWNRVQNFQYSCWIDHLLSVIALGLILYASCFLTVADYPSFLVLLPCIGAALFIYTGRKETSLGNRIFSCKPFVFLGLISYSLYLWHWPFIAYLHSLSIPIGSWFKISILVFSICLATLTWYVIEQPFRFKFTFSFFKTSILYLLIPLTLAGCFLNLIASHPFIGFNTISPQVYLSANNFQGPLKACNDGSNASSPAPEDVCALGDLQTNQTQVLIVGDSHAMAYASMLDVWLKSKNLKAYLIARSGTPFLLGNIPEWRSNEPMVRNQFLKKTITANRYKYVVMAAWWNAYPNSTLNGYFERAGFWGNSLNNIIGMLGDANNNYSILEMGLKNAIQVIIAAGGTPVIILDFPPLLNISKYCGFTYFSNSHSCFNQQQDILTIQSETRNRLFLLKKTYPQLIIIDPSKIICKEGKCFSSIGNTPLYWNNGKDSHLNYAGSHLIGQLYLKQYGNPFDSK